jgi:hypothetical protein
MPNFGSDDISLWLLYRQKKITSPGGDMSRLKHLRTRRLAVIGAAVTLASGLVSIGSVSAAAPRTGAAAVTKTFSFVGHQQFFHVPAGVTLVTIEAVGAQGGSSREAGDSPVSVAGAKGGMASATIPVTTGEELAVFVGGQPARELNAPGGFNGGGASGHGMTPRPGPDCGHVDQPPCPRGGNGGGGGGASDVRVGGDSLARRAVVAGGGGGGGGDVGKCVGGAGGGVTGDPGSRCDIQGRAFQGGGGTQSQGGSAGFLNGDPGSADQGGKGGTDPGSTIFGGAGGGGGWYGGGGGSGGDNAQVGGGGGGGSGHVPASDPSARMQNGVHDGNGRVTITYGQSPPTLDKSFNNKQILIGNGTFVTFVLSNPNTEVSLNGVAFTDSLPNGLAVTNYFLQDDCGGAIDTPGSSSIDVSRVTLGKSSHCTIQVSLIGTRLGHIVNTTSPVTSEETGPGKADSASIEVHE